jgi:hypothetical protein
MGKKIETEGTTAPFADCKFDFGAGDSNSIGYLGGELLGPIFAVIMSAFFE